MNLSRQTGARARRLLLTVIAVLAGAAGVAYATTQITTASPAQTSVVSACANKTNGDLRLVSGSGDCRTNEQLLSWNVVGPQGATGPQGPQGVQGVQGVQGPAGKDGQNVTSSLLGANDPNCLFGGASFTAFDRQTYACNGAPGRAGANGKNGANGTNGIDGVNGHDGANGNDGVSVTSTPLAANDPNCQYGGAAFTSASGTTYACNGAPGANGTNGTNGRDGTSGAGLTSFDGVNGLPCTRVHDQTAFRTGRIAQPALPGGHTAPVRQEERADRLTRQDGVEHPRTGAVGHDDRLARGRRQACGTEFAAHTARS